MLRPRLLNRFSLFSPNSDANPLGLQSLAIADDSIDLRAINSDLEASKLEVISNLKLFKIYSANPNGAVKILVAKRPHAGILLTHMQVSQTAVASC